jgi:hypothetical protein
MFPYVFGIALEQRLFMKLLLFGWIHGTYLLLISLLLLLGLNQT